MSDTRPPTGEPDYQTRLLTPETWEDFAALVETNNGVWGGCSERERRRILKRRRAGRAGRAAAPAAG